MNVRVSVCKAFVKVIPRRERERKSEEEDTMKNCSDLSQVPMTNICFLPFTSPPQDLAVSVILPKKSRDSEPAGKHRKFKKMFLMINCWCGSIVYCVLSGLTERSLRQRAKVATITVVYKLVSPLSLQVFTRH